MSRLTMQDVLFRLHSYWAGLGCIVVQPFNTEVGAGTGNPATALRVLGPEQWNVAYVEPSVRPDDARYGENPNRLQTHTQFQVILKPDPGNPQELYLASLEALGIDVRSHDVRFVEDNWASPALGAWGLGWEVWLDGLEITQFTYFQQAGGQTLDPVSVEITYGIERIVMALQGVSHFKDIAYAPGVSYGEVFGQAEYEMSRYYLDDADIDANRGLFDVYADEARRMIQLRLPVPAYVFVLKCSHTFNVLDSRGAISTTERAKAFGQMRTLTRQVAGLWTERRAELGHPLGVAAPPAPAALPAELPTAERESTLLFEIGVEELPHGEVQRSADTIREAVITKLAATRLEHGEVRSFVTPRRIAVLVNAVKPRERDAQRTVRGPKVSAAFGTDGKATKAAEGFARGQGVDVGELQRLDVGGVEYVCAVKTDTGRNAVAVLSGLLGQVVSEMRSERNMRWRDEGLSFARPVRWLVALLGDTVVPVTVSSLAAGRTTRVQRTSATPEVEVPSADAYLDLLAAHGIVADAAERRRQIITSAQDLASSAGGTIDFDADAALLDEVANLVEQPNAILGRFADRYLDLPSPILTTVMRKHQRYLPVRLPEGGLLPCFVGIANGPCDEQAVRAGYEAVLRARYEDSAFFWRADLKITPEEHKAGLDKLTFEEHLGSVSDRAERIARISAALGAMAGLNSDEGKTLSRASRLAKFDLASQMVIELSSLAGVMAREYAIRAGETAEVANALAEMELPRGAGSELPTSRTGAVLALADRFDLIAGLFAVGVNPSGSSDPFGLRRAAVGVVSILRAFPSLSAVTVNRGLSAAAEALLAQDIEVPPAALDSAKEFIWRRYEQQLLDTGIPSSLVQAVLPQADAPSAADATLTELERRSATLRFEELTAALQRARRIVPAGTSASHDQALLKEPAEAELAEALARVGAQVGQATTFGTFADIADTLIEPVNAFFDQVLVMAEDPALRASRLGLLASINELADRYLDWRALKPRQAADARE
jgi:glycyl-tRNA synthetase